MLEQLENFLDFSGPNLHFQTFLLAAGLWAMVVCCTVASILSKGFPRAKRNGLVLVVVLVPIFGVLFYLPMSLQRESLPFVPFWRRQFRKA